MDALPRVFHRFEDAEVEARYRLEQRTRQSGFTRTMALIVVVIFVWYAMVNPIFIAEDDVLRIAAAQFSMVPLMYGYAWYVGRPGYAANRWVDLALFVAIQPATLAWVGAFSGTGVSGWPWYAELAFDLWLELAFACLAFAAIPRKFAVLAALSAVYYPALLLIRGYHFPVVFYSSSFFVSFAFILAYVSWSIDQKARTLFALRHELDQERLVSQRLLDSALPRQVSDRLRTGEQVADRWENTTVVFADIVGFTGISRDLPGERVVELLNAFFSHADRGVDLFGLDKAKTIGDAYMAVSGAMTRPEDPAKAAIEFARYLLAGTTELGERFGTPFRLKIGINTGPVIGGVISAKRISYDYWGDTINLAARLQDVAARNGVAVSASTLALVREHYRFSGPRTVALKGIGEFAVYDLEMG